MNKKPTNLISKSNHAFTMIELLLVVAIMGVLAAVGAPSLFNWMNSLKMHTRVEGVYNALNKARSEALRRNLPIQVRFDANGNWDYGCVYIDNDPTSSMFCPSGVLEMSYTTNLEQGDFVFSTTNGSTIVTFNGIGAVIDDPLTLTASIDEISMMSPTVSQQYQIMIKSGGAFKLCDPAAATGRKLCN